jgi:hypothetical protein
MSEQVCYKCRGLGFLPWFKNIDDVTCYRCEGKGYIIIKPKASGQSGGVQYPRGYVPKNDGTLADFFASLQDPT